MKVKVKQINGVNYEYLDVGKGSIIFAFHGMGSVKESFYGFIKNLSKNYRLIIPDLPGHQNISLEGFENIENFSHYCERFIEDFNLKYYGLLGFSFGGNIARSISNNLFKKHKKMIPTVIWSTPLNTKMLKSQPKKIFAFSRLIPRKYYKVISERTSFWKFLNMLGIKLNKSDQGALKKTDIRVLQKGTKLLVDNRFQESYSHHLYIFDNRDIFVGTPINNLKNLIYVEGGGHFGNQKARDVTLKKIINFYKQNGL